MKQNDFYEVDGCMDFIPVTINETYADGVGVTVDNYMQGYRLVVKEVYRFPKVNEPQKVVVPKFVAEWYERNKDDLNTAIYSAITGTYRKVNLENDYLLDTFEEWLVYEDNSISIFAQMRLFGYEIEQEQLYVVNLGKIVGLSIYLRKTDKSLYPQRNDWSTTGDIRFAERLTEQKIKQQDERLWQLAVEVEESK